MAKKGKQTNATPRVASRESARPKVHRGNARTTCCRARAATLRTARRATTRARRYMASFSNALLNEGGAMVINAGRCRRPRAANAVAVSAAPNPTPISNDGTGDPLRARDLETVWSASRSAELVRVFGDEGRNRAGDSLAAGIFTIIERRLSDAECTAYASPISPQTWNIRDTGAGRTGFFGC